MRVRYKSFEDMPPHLKCCEKTNYWHKKFAGNEFEVDGSTRHQDIICMVCGADHGGLVFTIISSSEWLLIDQVDIDEGGV